MTEAAQETGPWVYAAAYFTGFLVYGTFADGLMPPRIYHKQQKGFIRFVDQHLLSFHFPDRLRWWRKKIAYNIFYIFCHLSLTLGMTYIAVVDNMNKSFDGRIEWCFFSICFLESLWRWMFHGWHDMIHDYVYKAKFRRFMVVIFSSANVFCTLSILYACMLKFHYIATVLFMCYLPWSITIWMVSCNTLNDLKGFFLASHGVETQGGLYDQQGDL